MYESVIQWEGISMARNYIVYIVLDAMGNWLDNFNEIGIS